MENKRPTQCEQILQYLKEFGTITTFEAFTELGCVRLGARISEMRKDGINIIGETETRRNRFGKLVTFMRYHLGE